MSTDEKIFLCVDGFLAKDGKIFLLKRNVEPYKGFWAPGDYNIQGRIFYPSTR